jgi:hypothetical protein
LEAIWSKITEQKAENETLRQALVLTPENTAQGILSLQIIPNPQNIPSHPHPDQSLPQNNSPSPGLDQSPSQISPPPRVEQRAGPIRTERSLTPEIIDANSLTMQQAVDLFELLQAKKSKEAEKSVPWDGHILRSPGRNSQIEHGELHPNNCLPFY